MAGQDRVVVLTDEEWEALQAIAGQCGCVSGTGKTTGQPSVNQLLRRLASGELGISPAHMKPALGSGAGLVWGGR